MNVAFAAAFLLVAGLAFVVAAPVASAGEAPVAEAGVNVGVRGWKTAYRKSDAVFTVGANGGWMPLPWLELAGSLDHAWRKSRSEGLRITNTESWLTVGPRLGLWVDFVRLFVELGPSAVLRTVRYPDADVSPPWRISPGVATGAGFTIAVANRLGFTFRGDWRRRNDQSNLFFTLDVVWLFRPSTLTR